MLGDLHIKMAILNMSGKWFDESGWSSALIQAGVVTSSRADALLSASHIKHNITHYAHQVRNCCTFVYTSKKCI